MQMTSVREQVSWVASKRDEATDQGQGDGQRRRAQRVEHQQPLQPKSVDVDPHTLVVGGGIAGLQAAVELADAGNPVYLVEREPSIGGHMSQFDKTFPTLDCAACILTPKMSEVGTAREHRAADPLRARGGHGLRRPVPGQDPQEGTFGQRGPVHRLRLLRGEVPAQGAGHRSSRSGMGLPQVDLHALPPGRAARYR